MSQSILIIDDDPQIRQVLRIAIAQAGFDIEEAGDGAEGLTKARTGRFDLILLDIGMPAGNGHVVVERLRNIAETSDIPVIYLTARTSEDDYHRAREGGVTKYITKPFDAEVLLAAVESQLERAAELV